MTEPKTPISARPQSSDELQMETQAIRVGRNSGDPALAPTLVSSSVFVAPSASEAEKRALSSTSTTFYSRYGNPTVNNFEQAIAELEGAERSRAFSSGMGALTAAVLGICSAGDHIVAQRQLYAGTSQLLNAVCPRMGIDVTFVDGTKNQEWTDAIRPGRTMMCLAETPANPRLDVVDLEFLGSIAGPITVVDSTFAPPVLQRPLEFGVNLSVHSATKSIAGHNDAVIGVASGDDDLIEWLWGFAVIQGANASPHDALNALRGIRTLPLRIDRQSASASEIANMLRNHDAVTSVVFCDDQHHQSALIERQMSGPPPLVSFDTEGSRADAQRFVESTEICQLATSLGGPETLVTHPASTTHAGFDEAELAAGGISETTIRLSVGLEHPQDLIADLRTALRSVTNC